MLQTVSDKPLEDPTPAQVLRQALKARLEAEIPYLHIWQEAMALGALPLNFPYTLDNLNRLAQSVCELGNTNSTASKALVGSVFCATELYMLHDKSPEFVSTWRFLDQRLGDVIKTNEFLGQTFTLLNLGKNLMDNTMRRAY